MSRVEKYTKLVQAQTPKDAVADLMSMGPEMADYVIELEQSARLVRALHGIAQEGRGVPVDGMLGIVSLLDGGVASGAYDAWRQVEKAWARQRERLSRMPSGPDKGARS